MTWLPDFGEVGLYVRTVRNLRPTQIGHRLRLRTQRALVPLVAGPAMSRWRRVPERAEWPEQYKPLWLSLQPAEPAAAAVEGRFSFLNDERALGTPIDWHPQAVSQLWSYHLHYWEWAWGFATWSNRPDAANRFIGLWRDWKSGTSFGRWDEWSPYVVSLRTWVLCNLWAALHRYLDNQDSDELLADIVLHGRFVDANLELDVSGNHLIKNLKAVVAVSVLTCDDRALARALDRLHQQVSIQVLADGGHYERSPSYHCQILFDLLEVERLLTSARRPCPPWLAEATVRMRTWLGVMVMPDGDVPLFNDCALVGQQGIAALNPITPPDDSRLNVLEATGYVVCRLGPAHLVIDVGDACPPELPAHAHADCLSFELALGGRRVIVDAGTFSYGSGTRRVHDRSTRSHNTVEVDGEDQTEVWSAFRAARIAHGRLEGAEAGKDGVTVWGSHDGYLRLPAPATHRRRFHLHPKGLEIEDRLESSEVHDVRAGLNVLDPRVLSVDLEVGEKPASIETRSTTVATEFGTEIGASRLEWNGSLTKEPLRWTLSWPSEEVRQEGP